MNRRQVIQTGGLITLEGLLGCSRIQIPKLELITLKEVQLFEYLQDKPELIKRWINLRTKSPPEYDETTYNGEFWAPALEFVRTRAGDCDEVLAFCHYLLGSGVGLYLHGREGEDGKEDASGHAVYLYPGTNQKIGIISINKLEQKRPIFDNYHQAAFSFSKKTYDYFKILRLPEDRRVLLSSREGIEHLTESGPEIYLK